MGEVREPFGAGQKGSSAMPHKRNPIKSEQITGLARLLRGNAQAAVEDVALWHERDISHSSVERVILPDSTILLNHLQRRALALVDGMVVDTERMRSNLDLTCGALFSQRVLLAVVETGLTRDDAYRIVQRLAQGAIDQRTPLRELLAADPAGRELDLDSIFDYAPFVRYADEIVGRLDAIVPVAEPAAALRSGRARARGARRGRELPASRSGSGQTPRSPSERAKLLARPASGQNSSHVARRGQVC